MSRKEWGWRDGAVAAIFILIALLCWGGVYLITDASCRDRGGHTEIVWGGRGGWTCDGANR